MPLITHQVEVGVCFSLSLFTHLFIRDIFNGMSQKNSVHDLRKKEYLLLPKSVWLFVGPTFLFGPSVFWLYMTPRLFYPSSLSVSISGNEFSLWLLTECYTMIIRQHCSVMILPFFPALEPRLDLFVIIHHPFPLSSCIISIILRVSTWLNLIHLTKKKKILTTEQK